MEIKIYMHRTKKKNFAVCDSFPITVDLTKLPEDKQTDIEFINLGFKNDVQKIARTRDCIKKYGTGYVAFLRPQYEGPEEENGTDKVYFDNTDTIFKLREEKDGEENE